MTQTTKYLKTLGNAIIGKTHKDIEGLLDYIDDIHAEYEYVTHQLNGAEKVIAELKKPAGKVKVVKATKPASGKLTRKPSGK